MNPTITDIVDSDNVLKFTIKNINSSLINSIRRIILSEIPCFVFRTFPYDKNKANIEINTSRFNNEVIKQRLSCIPIHIKDNKFPYNDHQMEVDVFNDTKEIIYVTTNDFKIKNKKTNSYISKESVKEIFPPNSITDNYIDFLRLQPQLAENIPGEHIKLSCDFDIGYAKENGAFNVVSTCSFGGTIDISKIEEKWKLKEASLSEEDKEDIEFVKKDWLLIEGARIIIPDSFDFIIKSIGIYSNFEIMIMACDIMINKITNFIKDIQEKPIIKKSDDTLTNCYDIILENEDYTLGKVIEYLLYVLYFNSEIKFCGFKKPHPHINSSLLKLAFIEDVDNDLIISKIVKASVEGIKIYEQIKDNFMHRE
jgi:DNA-directed RNA polymerase subunit L